LREKRTTAAVFVEGAANATTTAGDRDLWRVTMTASFINRAACVVFLVSGGAKAGVVREVLQGSAHSKRLPARLIDPGGILRWHLDEEAAALLDGVGERN
jgi:6-phosphogluconolactonase/glucosamine-6-phosphate isomerase/deaminase